MTKMGSFVNFSCLSPQLRSLKCQKISHSLGKSFILWENTMNYWVLNNHWDNVVNPKKNTGFWYFFCWLNSFLHFHPQYLRNHTVFWKNLIKCALKYVLPKLWLIYSCHQHKIQKISHFWHFNDDNSGSIHAN